MTTKSTHVSAALARRGLGVAAIVLAFGGDPALADSDHGHIDGADGMPHFGFGEPGHINDVDRTIEIEAGDVFFSPTELEIAAGETIRFVITKTGSVVHDFTLGSAAMQEAHRGEMMNMMNAGAFDAMFMHQAVAHQDWNAIMVNPGERRIMVWGFDEPGTLEFGCNVPGHYESGMRGDIEVGE